MIQFKKGSFVSLRSVQPVYIVHKSFTKVSPSMDVCGFISHLILSQGCGLMKISVHYLPDFEPNEYFWQHHWQEGKEEKWEAFARAVRDTLSEYSGLPKSELQMEDKFAYLKALKQLKATTNKEK